MKNIKKIFRILIKSVAGLTAFVLFYVIIAFGLSKIEVNTDVVQNQDIDIYLLTNGVHTDVVMPIKSEFKDWSADVLFKNTKTKDSVMNFVAIGWGDKGFYLDTPQWSDLKVSTAFKATTGLGNTAMHVTFYKSLNENESCKKVKISKDNFTKLITYVSDSFQRNSSNKIINIPNHYYGKNDAFYEANGSYSLMKTCNTWANGALKASNQKAAFWTPFDHGIFCHYE